MCSKTNLKFRCQLFKALVQAITLIIIPFLPAAPVLGSDYSTGDGLTIGVTSEGRVYDLTIGNQSITLCNGSDGGLYIRDYTPDATGLPEARGSGNLITNPYFDSGLNGWTRGGSGVGQWEIIADERQVSGGETELAIVHLTELGSSLYWATMYQDIYIGPGSPYEDPTEHELFCFAFDMATECGFRPSDHPAGHDPDEHGSHQISGHIWWFDTNPTQLQSPGDNTLAKTKLQAYETTNSFVAANPPDPAYMVMTRYGARSYRPMDSTYVRVGVQVKGFIPNDDTNWNEAYFDNFAFYKAPPITPVKADELLGGGTSFAELKDLDGNTLSPPLEGWATVTPVNQGDKHYLLIEGELQNPDDLRSRAIDLGFAIPIKVQENVQEVEWWDDTDHSEYIHLAEQLLPFRMAGKIDTRPKLINEYEGYSDEITKVRAESAQISAYPFSAIDIHRGNVQYGFSFGDNLDSECVNISHFGYRVLQPFDAGPPYTPFQGICYVEFRLGIREELSGDNITPFSFLIFRSDNSAWKEASSFREAAEEYEVDIFPEFFSRPTITEDPWLFGGGVLFPDRENGEFDTDGFNYNPSDFGLRYTNARYDAYLNQTQYIQLINWCGARGVGVVTYGQPWRAGFQNPTALNMNYYTELINQRNAFDPSTSTWHWGDIWQTIYNARKLNYLSLPGGVSLFSNRITDFVSDSNDREEYYFPVLIADTPLGEANLLTAELDYIREAYSNAGNLTIYGLRGAEFDNVFSSMQSANHLDLTENRFVHYTEATEDKPRGILTYSINHLSPAIPQLATNVWFLDEVRDTLDEIDNVSPHGDSNSIFNEEEIISGNMMEPEYGGSKFGIMYADVAGFENSVSTAYNSSARAQNFRRTIARDKNMARLHSEVPCLETVLDMWHTYTQCEKLNIFWGYHDYDALRVQIVNEVAWMSLAWGFLPSINVLLPEWELTENGFDEFIDGPIRDLFATNPFFGLSFTNIFKELHLAGWRPITNAVANDGTNPVNLFVERFGDQVNPLVHGSHVYFTVLNNDGLTITFNDLAAWDPAVPIAEKSLNEVYTMQEIEDYLICPYDFECQDFPTMCPTGDFESRSKDFFLDIHDPMSFGLWHGNLECTQLVSNYENIDVFNWPVILAKSFTEGAGSNAYSLRRVYQIQDSYLRIGGTWPSMSQQLQKTIDDKVLMVFRFNWTLIVDNGDGGRGQGSESRGGSEDDAASTSFFYERCGSGWQTYDTAGYNGTVDAVTADSGAFVLYKINIGEGGRYDVKVHFPTSQSSTAGAQYDVFILDYQEELIGNTELGTPVLTAIIDQSDHTTYSEQADVEGFISIGSIDVDLQETYDLSTVVIKLSVSEEESRSSDTASALLVSDTVLLEPAG